MYIYIYDESLRDNEWWRIKSPVPAVRFIDASLIKGTDIYIYIYR